MARHKLREWLRKHLFVTTGSLVASLVHYDTATKSQKVRALTPNFVSMFYMLGQIARQAAIYPAMSDPARLYEYRKTDYSMYYVMINYANGDTFFVYSFMLMACQSFAPNYYSAFRLGSDFSELIFMDLPKLFQRSNLVRLRFWQYPLAFRSRRTFQETIQSFEPYVQSLSLRSNPYLSRNEKAKVLFWFRYSLYHSNFGIAFVSFMGFFIFPLTILMTGMRPSEIVQFLITFVDLLLFILVFYHYAMLNLLNIFVCNVVSSIWVVSLLSNYRRFKQAINRQNGEGRATKLYSSMTHCQRIFVGAMSTFDHMNETIVRYFFTAQFCFAGVSVTILIVGSAMQRFSIASKFGLVLTVSSELLFFSFAAAVMVIGAKLLYSHVSSVRQCNVSLAKCPGMIYRKWKANTFLELLGRKRWSFSLGPLGKINSRTVLSCLLFYSSLFMTFIQQYQ